MAHIKKIIISQKTYGTFLFISNLVSIRVYYNFKKICIFTILSTCKLIQFRKNLPLQRHIQQMRVMDVKWSNIYNCCLVFKPGPFGHKLYATAALFKFEGTFNILLWFRTHKLISRYFFTHSTILKNSISMSGGKRRLVLNR